MPSRHPPLHVCLFNSVPPGTYYWKVTQTAALCATGCLANAKCDFFTWHDLTVVSYEGHCYFGGAPACYDPDLESHHFSGVYNHTKRAKVKLKVALLKSS